MRYLFDLLQAQDTKKTWHSRTRTRLTKKKLRHALHERRRRSELLEPERAGVPEHGHELAGEVERHDPVGAADEVAAHEHRRHGGCDAAAHGTGGAGAAVVGLLIWLLFGLLLTVAAIARRRVTSVRALTRPVEA